MRLTGPEPACFRLECPKPILLPENEIVWELISHLVAQARVAGMGGFIGFDYSVLPMLFTAYDVPESQWFFLLEKINALTEVASRHFNKKEESG